MSMRRRRTPATAHVQFSETAGKIKLANIQKIIMDSVGDKDLLEGRDSERFGEQGSLPRFLPHHIKIMKVALALAIIRQKPEGVSSREYTERLALQFSQLQLDWRERTVQLQQELLRTRQELTKYQIQSETLNQTHKNSIATGIHWNDSEWQSSGYSSSFPLTSQDGEQATQLTVNGDHKLDGSTNKSHRIATHVKFLASVSSVLDTRHTLSVLTESDVRTTVRDTVLHATRVLTEVLSGSQLPALPPSLDNLHTATQTIVDVIQAPRMTPFREEMISICEDLLETIVDRISSHQDSQSEELCSLVCILSSVPALYRHAVQRLTSAVITCAEMLARATQDVGELNVVTVECVSIVFKTLERLFTKYDTSPLPPQMCSELYSELESPVLGISSSYPLFAFSVWTILAHLTPSNAP